MEMKGQIFDATTGNPLPSATVQVILNGSPTGEGDVANNQGNYDLTYSNAASTVNVSYTGFETVQSNAINGSQNFTLFPSNTGINGVTVVGKKGLGNGNIKSPDRNVNGKQITSTNWIKIAGIAAISIAAIILLAVIFHHPKETYIKPS